MHGALLTDFYQLTVGQAYFDLGRRATAGFPVHISARRRTLTADFDASTPPEIQR